MEIARDVDNVKTSMTVSDLNQLMVCLRIPVKKAKLRVTQKIIRKIKIYKEKKGNEKQMAKNARKYSKLLEEQHILKSSKPDDIIKFGLLNELTIGLLSTKGSLKDVVYAKVTYDKSFQDFVIKWRKEHEDWKSLAAFLMSHISRRYKKNTKTYLGRDNITPEKNELDENLKDNEVDQDNKEQIKNDHITSDNEFYIKSDTDRYLEKNSQINDPMIIIDKDFNNDFNDNYNDNENDNFSVVSPFTRFDNEMEKEKVFVSDDSAMIKSSSNEMLIEEINFKKINKLSSPLDNFIKHKIKLVKQKTNENKQNLKNEKKKNPVYEKSDKTIKLDKDKQDKENSVCEKSDKTIKLDKDKQNKKTSSNIDLVATTKLKTEEVVDPLKTSDQIFEDSPTTIKENIDIVMNQDMVVKRFNMADLTNESSINIPELIKKSDTSFNDHQKLDHSKTPRKIKDKFFAGASSDTDENENDNSSENDNEDDNDYNSREDTLKFNTSNHFVASLGGDYKSTKVNSSRKCVETNKFEKNSKRKDFAHDNRHRNNYNQKFRTETRDKDRRAPMKFNKDQQNTMGKLHPSWEAKRKQKEHDSKLVPFLGKKIIFAD